jgi:hypothetical protein
MHNRIIMMPECSRALSSVWQSASLTRKKSQVQIL